MLLILEIGLTIAAWKRGWKGWAVLPLVIAFFIGFFWGLVNGGPLEELLGFGIIFDVLCIVALIVMIARPRRKASCPPAIVNSAPATQTDKPEPARKTML
jgi:hypothetical protein